MLHGSSRMSRRQGLGRLERWAEAGVGEVGEGGRTSSPSSTSSLLSAFLSKLHPLFLPRSRALPHAHPAFSAPNPHRTPVC